MKNPLSRVPWFLGTPVFLGAVVIAAFVSNYLGADYFKRTRLDEANPLAGVEAPVGSSQGTVLYSGDVRDGEPGHRGEGTATIIKAADGKLTLRLENFSVTNGPDLFVVLSSDVDAYSPSGSLNLGSLKATDGNFNYDIPDGTDLSQFKSVIVWCKQFDVTFAVATLSGDAAASAPNTNAPVAQASQATPTEPAPPKSSTTPTSSAAQPATPTPAATTTKAPTQAAAATVVPTVAPATSGPKVFASGAFRNGAPGHQGSGNVTLGQDGSGKAFLVFEGFSVTNGPDLHVILGSSPDGGGQGLDLGKLKATDGNFNYPIPDGTDLSQFRSVTIWCASFPTIFAVATLGG